jgi:hypothetical protein
MTRASIQSHSAPSKEHELLSSTRTRRHGMAWAMRTDINDYPMAVAAYQHVVELDPKQAIRARTISDPDSAEEPNHGTTGELLLKTGALGWPARPREGHRAGACWPGDSKLAQDAAEGRHDHSQPV